MNKVPPKYIRLKAMEPSLKEVFDNFYVKLLSNEKFAVFFENEQVTKQLVIKQKKNFLESIEMSPEEFSDQFQYLGRFHFEKQIPYINFFRGAEILRNEMIDYGVKENLPAEIFRDLYLYTEETNNLMAKGYLQVMLELDLEEVILFRHTLLKINSPESRTVVEQITWLEKLINSLIEGDLELLSKEINNNSFETLHAPKKFRGKIFSNDYIEDLYQRLKKELSSLCYFLEENSYATVLPLYGNLLSIYKLLLFLTNVTSWEANYDFAVKTVKLDLSKKELETFAHMMAHDLKSPLASIISFNELLSTQFSKFTLEDLQSHIARMLKISKNMNTFVEELLTFFTAKSKTLQREKITIKVLMEDIKENLASLILESQGEIIEINTEEKVFIDQFLFGQVLQNLIANSFKYRSEVIPKVTISVSSDPQNVKVVIKDNGKGMPSDQLDKVFDVFYRLDHDTEGSGLGLPFSKSVIEKHSGKIALESKLRQGTTVTITLPQG